MDSEGKTGMVSGMPSENDGQYMLIGSYWESKPDEGSIYINSEFQNTWILLANPLELHSIHYKYDAWFRAVSESFSCLKKFIVNV